MQLIHQPDRPSKAAGVTGRVLSTIAVLFMLMDGGMKVWCPPFVVQSSAPFGYTPGILRLLGVLVLAFTALYVMRRTAVLGAIFMTGFLGGAVAANVQAHTPAFNMVFPLLFAAVMWGGLWLRDMRLRTLVPLSADTEPGAPATSAAPVPSR